jgi:hypothetical protein
MKLDKLADWCDMNGIDWKEVGEEHPNGKGYLFHWNNPNNLDDEECCHVIEEQVENLPSHTLMKLVVNGRDVIHITRVCGYYSRVSNWNKSKVGELKDRHNGNYGVTDGKQEEKKEQEVVSS